MLRRVPATPPSWAKERLDWPDHKLRLGNLPTPIFPWHPPGLPPGIELWIKRDDFSGLEMSGNKVRKLEYLLCAAKDAGCDCVLTAGGIQSNHCRATAAACAMLGLDCHLILRVKDKAAVAAAASNPTLVGNLLVARMVGATVHLVSQADYAQHGSDTLLDGLRGRLARKGARPYVVPVGGSSSVGTFGYVAAVEEMRTGTREQGISDVVFACGSGGTAAGIGLGVKLSAWDVRAHAMMVCDDADYFKHHIDEVIAPTMWRQRGGRHGDHGSGKRDLVSSALTFHQCMGLGYAQSTTEELRFLRRVAKETGVLLDPVYSGKAAFHMLRMLREEPKRFKGRRILFVHTGGLLGTYAKVDEIVAATDLSQPKPLLLMGAAADGGDRSRL